MPHPPVPVAPGVWRLPTIGRTIVNSFALIDDDGTVTLIDTGLRGAPRRLTAALSELGKRPADVVRIVLTHVHRDHAGGAQSLRERTGGGVHIHAEDRSFLETGRQPPSDQNVPLARVLRFTGSRGPSCPVDGTFAEGDLLPVLGGLRVLHTPGHTPGHCSFLLERSGVLITGDALFNFRNKISWSMAAFCSNVSLSKETAERLGEVDYDIVAFTHGPEIRDGARKAVRGFLQRRR